MSAPLSESRKRRVHLAGERVVLAIAIATPGGVGSLTIRLLAQHRGVKPMAIRTRFLTDTSSRVSSHSAHVVTRAHRPRGRACQRCTHLGCRGG
jgi:hypothetical protein